MATILMSFIQRSIGFSLVFCSVIVLVSCAWFGGEDTSEPFVFESGGSRSALILPPDLVETASDSLVIEQSDQLPETGDSE